MTAKRCQGRSEAEVSREVMQALALFAGQIDIDRQNTGGGHNASGQYVAFGRPGNADMSGMVCVGPHRGKKFDLEIKRESFNPRRLRGAKRDHFLRQLDRLRRTNDNGGIGLWVRSAENLLYALPRILAGARVVFDEQGFPYLEDDEP